MRKMLLLLILMIIFIFIPASAFAGGGLEGWSYFDAVAAMVGLPVHVVCYLSVAVFLVITGVMVGGAYNKKLAAYATWKDQPIEGRGPSPIDPSPKFSLSNFFETLIQMTLNMMEDVIGPGSKRFFPIIGSLAFVILFNNITVLLPGGNNATANVNTNLAMAIVVFILYNYYGIREHGIGKYAAHFMGPLEGKIKYIMAPLMVPIELISHLVRPASLTLRLFGNMYGDHSVFLVFMGLLATFGLASVPPLLYPVPILALGTLVCVVQTLVFTLLSMVYISLAVAHDH